jgi:hypothetical protein
MPRERAWTVAVRLDAEGRSAAEIHAGLVAHGFPFDEAQLAVGALADGKLKVDRWGDEARAKQAQDSAYMKFLFASLLIAAGMLVALIFDGLLGALGLASLCSGGVLLVRGLWLSWRGHAR